MKRIQWSPLLLPVFLAAVIGCATEEEEQPADAPAVPAVPPAAVSEPATPVVATMDITGLPGSATPVTGKAEVLGTDPSGASDTFILAMHLENVPAGEHAWHIHEGSCAAKGTPVVVAFTADGDKPGIAGPLTADASGKLDVQIEVPAAQLSLSKIKAGDFSVHVHEKSGTDHGPSIACATL